MGISVIIPTFDNIEYIDETLDSIYKSGKNFDYEILIGIDGCNKSLNSPSVLSNASFDNRQHCSMFFLSDRPV